ncbi:MAG: TIGR01244 family sulfur transferase [Pseudomonadota bacterium]
MTIQMTQHSKEFSTTPQIQLTDMQEIAQLGFKTIINNRPDFEGGAEQPTSEQIKAAAEKLGLAYIYIPVIPNNIQAEQVSAFNTAFAKAKKPVLGFCKTGNRASSIYQLSQSNQLTQQTPAKGLLQWLKSKCLVTRLFRFCRAKLA